LAGTTLENHLKNNKIKTIVFVPGGVLRTIPIEALYDGNQFQMTIFHLVYELFFAENIQPRGCFE
jgi:CHAT domain-containing protein